MRHQQMERLQRHPYYHLAVYSAAVLLLSRFGLLSYLCTVPLHLLRRRYPVGTFYKAAGALTAAVLLLDTYRLIGAGLNPADYLLAAVGLFYPTTLLAGVLVFYLPSAGTRMRRLFTASLVPGAAGLVMLLILNGESEAARSVKDFYLLVVRELTVSVMQVPGEESVEFLFDLAFKVMKSTFYPMWIWVFGFSVLLSDIISAGSGNQSFLDEFRVSDRLLWPFIAAWTLVLADVLFRLGTLGDIAWNAALTMLLIYGTAGISLLAYWSRKRRGRANALSWVMLALFLLFVPGINGIMLIAIPVLGLSEHWVRYRFTVKEKDNEDNS
jgi:hypothetical protein